MVRIIPNRLRSFRNGDSANNSGTSTPRIANQLEASPGAAKMSTNGLMLNVVVMRVCFKTGYAENGHNADSINSGEEPRTKRQEWHIRPSMLNCPYLIVDLMLTFF